MIYYRVIVIKTLQYLCKDKTWGLKKQNGEFRNSIKWAVDLNVKAKTVKLLEVN